MTTLLATSATAWAYFYGSVRFVAFANRPLLFHAVVREMSARTRGQLQASRSSRRIVLVTHGKAERLSAVHPDAGISRPAIRRWVVSAALIAAYVVLEWISFMHEFKWLPLTPWNPGLGLAFASLIVSPRYAFSLFIGVIIAETVVLQSDLEWGVIVAIGVIVATGYTFIATVIRKKFQLDVGLSHLRDVIILLAAAFLGSALVTMLLVGVLLAAGKLSPGDVMLAAPASIVGDVLGIAVTTPLILRFARRWRERTLDQLVAWIPEFALLAVVIIGALWVIAKTETADGFTLFYLLFFPVVVGAVRRGLDGACLALAATQFGLVALLHHHGYDWRVFTEFQVLMFVLTATGLVVGVVVSERQASERMARDSEARLKEKEAEVAHAARFSLVSGMATALAHEINQPMAAARALGRSVQELLRNPQVDLNRADQNLTRLVAEIDLAGGILRRMRDFLRRGRPQVSTIDVALMMRDILALIGPEAASRGVEIDLDCPSDLPPVHGDKIQLQQVVLNLVRNSIDSIAESSRADGRVRLTVRRSDNATHLEIRVLDNGAGIPADRIEQLFTPLATSKKDGLGLGLSISLTIVEAHGGRIWLHSHQAGATEFRLSLPLEAPAHT